MPVQQLRIDILIPISFTIFHTVFLFKALNLTMPKHRQPRHGNHHGTNPKIFVPFSELFYRGFLIGIVHKIDIAFKNIRIKFQCAFEENPIFGIIFIP